jgi:(+)-pinoresinol hydroxylase
MRTPPGVSEADFAKALQQFAGVVGSQWVISRDDEVATYKDAYSPLWGESDEKVASAAVAPDSVEQIQKVLAIANRFAIPLYTVSTGRNLAYGGSSPVYSGSVVLDLKRMNRVLEVSEEYAYALVEPGVSYFDLYRHLRDKGLKLWIDVPDPGWGSPVGNSLDHGALLEERTDLTPEAVAAFVRHGGGGFMPAFRPTEVSDEDLKALGAYLARKR